jgi:hypothetical protein
MSDTRPEPAEQAGDAPASKPTSADQALASESVQLLDGTITGVDAHHYKVSVSLVGVPNPVQGVGYNPLAYIPKPDEHVLVAFVGPDVENARLLWVLGVESSGMFGSPTHGRPPTAALWSSRSQEIKSGTQDLKAVVMDQKAWDTDGMVSGLGSGQTTKITPRRTGVYTVKAGGRWEKDAELFGRRGMDLRWDDGGIIARDERDPNSEGECSHSVSADVMITSTEPAPASPWARRLGAAVELVVYQTSGRPLRLLSDGVKPFLQMTYQGPKP